jgi:hypothetical protein
MVANRRAPLYLIPVVIGLAGSAYAFRIGDEGLIGGLTLMGFVITFVAFWAAWRVAMRSKTGPGGVA